MWLFVLVLSFSVILDGLGEKGTTRSRAPAAQRAAKWSIISSIGTEPHMHRKRNPCNSISMVNMASSMYRGCVNPMAMLCNVAAML